MLQPIPHLAKLFLALLGFLLCAGCHDHEITIAEEIENPNHAILETLIPLLENSTEENIKVEIVDHKHSSIEALKEGTIDLYITDNNETYNEDLTAVAPLFPEVLHILHKKNYTPSTLPELLEGKRIHAGEIGSIEYSLCKSLIVHYGINDDNIEFLSADDLFESDVIMMFTDLVTVSGLRDLEAYDFYSLDDPALLGSGTIAEAISIRHPGLTPFIIPKSTYGNFTPKAILTLMNESVLICRKNMDEHIAYEILRTIKENKQLFYNISPLMHLGFNDDFENSSPVYPLHSGTINYLNRDKPTFLQRHSDFLGAVITSILALLSGIFTYRNYRNNKKKDNIDVYYKKLEDIRQQIPHTTDKSIMKKWQDDIHALESETINLVINERLNANESYIVFMNMVVALKKELALKLEK